MVSLTFLVIGPPHHTLVGPHHVERAEHHSEDGETVAARSDLRRCRGGSGNSPTKPLRPGNRSTKHHEHEDGGVHRRRLPEAAELGDLARMTAHVEHPDQQEECAGRDAVIEHLVSGALEALGD